MSTYIGKDYLKSKGNKVSTSTGTAKRLVWACVLLFVFIMVGSSYV